MSKQTQSNPISTQKRGFYRKQTHFQPKNEANKPNQTQPVVSLSNLFYLPSGIVLLNDGFEGAGWITVSHKSIGYESEIVSQSLGFIYCKLFILNRLVLPFSISR